MSNLTIKALYKFQKLPFEPVVFGQTYRLTGRSGKAGAIDQLLEIYPNCVAGIMAHDVEDEKLFLQIYLIYYRIRDGKVSHDDMVYNSFGLSEEERFFKSDEPFAIFLDADNPELYFLNEMAPSVMTEADSIFLDEQRILFNEQLEKVETAYLKIDDFSFRNDLKNFDFTDMNISIHSDTLLEIKSLAASLQN